MFSPRVKLSRGHERWSASYSVSQCLGSPPPSPPAGDHRPCTPMKRDRPVGWPRAKSSPCAYPRRRAFPSISESLGYWEQPKVNLDSASVKGTPLSRRRTPFFVCARVSFSFISGEASDLHRARTTLPNRQCQEPRSAIVRKKGTRTNLFPFLLRDLSHEPACWKMPFSDPFPIVRLTATRRE